MPMTGDTAQHRKIQQIANERNSSREIHGQYILDNGPNWLTERSKWPTWEQRYEIVTAVLENEATGKSVVPTTSTKITLVENLTSFPRVNDVIDAERYPSYKKRLRVTAYVFRFISSCRHTCEVQKTAFWSSQEILHAEKMWLLFCQGDTYTDEINCLKSNMKSLPLIKQLNLFLDNNGLIRCNGRIHNAPLRNDTKFPCLLPKKHVITRLIIEQAHVLQLHSGVNATVAFIRQKVWIPSTRQCVNSVSRKCVTCRRVTGKSFRAPDPPPLPKFRVQDEAPFSVTGVDFAGPLSIKTPGRLEGKAYICLFTCASTRAVHLEIVCDLTRDSFLWAFRRFASRKSLPHFMISDNVTTFTVAATYLKRMSESTTIIEELNGRGVEWQFIPKHAPWFGGFWERMVGLTKSTLKKILGRTFVDVETLQTFVREIECILNDRPLTHVSSDLRDAEPLTPAHLLYGRRITRFPCSHITERGCTTSSMRGRAKALNHIIDNFWKRWRSEYLTALREQHRKSGYNTQSIRVGDVVQVQEDTPRIRWRLAVVEQLITGNDGLVRAAKIRTCQGYT